MKSLAGVLAAAAFATLTFATWAFLNRPAAELPRSRRGPRTSSIIQHGTMTMVRRPLLEATGKWAEWCITEDAELGLKVFEAGYTANYIPVSYGRGLMPDTFIDFKRQRFRWAYGAMQILKSHAGSLFTGGGPLSAGRRYHFIAGWAPWVADGCNLLFNVAALAWSAAMVIAPHRIDPPLVVYCVLPLSLFSFKLAKLVHLYRARVGVSAAAGPRRAEVDSTTCPGALNLSGEGGEIIPRGHLGRIVTRLPGRRRLARG